MCFIKAFEKYMKSKYNIEIQEFNKKKKEKRFNKRKIWNISRYNFKSWVYFAAWKAGYDNMFFSPHSFRGGAICEMLKRAFTGGQNTFNEVFHQARVLGHWVNKSTAFKKYVKKPLLSIVVGSRFVDPSSKEVVVSEILQSSENLHHIKKPISRWVSNAELEYAGVYNNIKNQLIGNILANGPPVSQIALERDAGMFPAIINLLLIQFVKDYNRNFYNENIKGLSTTQLQDNQAYSKIRKEVICPLIDKTSTERVSKLFAPLVDEFKDAKNLDLNSEIFLFQSVINNHNLENIIIPESSLFSKIFHYNKYRKQFGPDNVTI